MKVKRLKELLEKMPDDMEVFIRNSVNICGNIGELDQVEKSYYGFFGDMIPCVILNTQYALPEREIFTEDDAGDKFIIDYRETDGKIHDYD